MAPRLLSKCLDRHLTQVLDKLGSLIGELERRLVTLEVWDRLAGCSRSSPFQELAVTADGTRNKDGRSDCASVSSAADVLDSPPSIDPSRVSPPIEGFLPRAVSMVWTQYSSFDIGLHPPREAPPF